MPSTTEFSALGLDDVPGVGCYVWRPGDGSLHWSAGLVRLYGRTAAPANEAEFMACLHPEDRVRVEGETESYLSGTAENYVHTFRILRPDGTTRRIIDRARISRDAEGRVIEIRGINMDATDAMPDAAPDAAMPGVPRDTAHPEMTRMTSGLVLANIDYRAGTVALSAAAARLFALGEAATTVPRAALHARFHPEDRAAMEERIRWALDPEAGGRLKIEHRLLLPDGTVRWIQVQKHIEFALRDGRQQPESGILTALDITDLRLALAGLRESEARLAMAQDVAGIGVWDVQLEEGRSVWTPALYDLLALDPSEPASPELFFRHVHPEDEDRVRRSFRDSIRKRTLFKATFRIVRTDGAIRHVIGQGNVIEEGKDGRARRMIGVNYDITERMEAEARLREGRNRQSFLRRLGDALRDASEARDAILAASTLLGHEMRASHVFFAEIDRAGIVHLQGEYREHDRIPSVAGRTFRLGAITRTAVTRLRGGSILRIGDIDADPDLNDRDRTRLRAAGLQSCLVAPLVIDGGLEACIVVAQDTPRRWTDPEAKLLQATAERTLDAVRRARSEAASRSSHARYQALFEKIDSGFCIVELRFDGPGGRADYRVIEANPAFYSQTGFPEAILGRWLRRAAPELEEHWYEIYGGVARTGEPARFEEYSELLNRWFDVYAFRIDAPEDRRVAILFEDVSGRKQNEAHVDTLLKEVQHRSKNMLSLVTVIARRTAAQGSEGFLSRFTSRIAALAANQDLVIAADGQPVALGDLVRRQLAHFDDLPESRIVIAGPQLHILPEAAQKLGMALHELATNAGKYGGLSDERGSVHVTWETPTRDGESRLVMTWKEQDGPTVTKPGRAGFGSLVSGSLLEAGLGGRTEVRYPPSGLLWRLDCPLAAVSGTAVER